MKKVIVVTGPTASGKTDLSVKLASFLNTEIINGDSVQTYQELNIGSAKIKENEMNNIKHHLLDINSILNEYTIFDYQVDVRNLLDSFKTIPIIVGGSGLYIKSALYDYRFVTLSNQENEISYNEKIEVIKKSDPNLKIDWNNKRRIDSAYNIIISGNKRSNFTKKDVPLYDIFTIYLDLDRKILKERIINRLDNMIKEGFIEEVKSLPKKDLNIIGYKQIALYLNNKLSLDEAKDAIIKASMKFAKRQKTWFLNQMESNIYNALDNNLFNNVKQDILNFIKD